MNHWQRPICFHLNLVLTLHLALFSPLSLLSSLGGKKYVSHQCTHCGKPLPLNPINRLNKPQLNWSSLHKNSSLSQEKGGLIALPRNNQTVMTTQGEGGNFLGYSPIPHDHTIWPCEAALQQLIIYNFKNNLKIQALMIRLQFMTNPIGVACK